MPPTRLPSGAPVPVGVAPTSSRRNAGGAKLMICQRSTLAVKPPALTKVGGAGASMIQRVTVTLSLRALHLDLRLIDQRRIADRGLVHEGEMREIEQIVDDELPVGLDVQVLAFAPQFGSSSQWKSVILSGSASAGSPIQIHSQ